MALVPPRSERLRSEEKAGLAAAVALHLALAGVLVFQPAPSPVPVPERMVVSLAEEVGLASEAPELIAESRASTAPTLAEEIAPSIEAPREVKAISEQGPVSDAVSPRPQPQPNPAPSRPDRGGSRQFDQAFAGAGSSTETSETRAPSASFGRAERAALASAITRQLRPHWTAPTGVDAELLVSIVSWQLNLDGTLKGRPTCNLQPSSITALNRTQAGLHCERAIRAVQLAAPFNLPEQFYSRWDDLEWQFDRRL